MDSHRKVSHIPGYQSNRWFFVAIMKTISSSPQEKKKNKARLCYCVLLVM